MQKKTRRIEMRRNHYIALVVSIVVLWIVALNYTLVKRMNGSNQGRRHLDKLEKDLEIAINNSDSLIRDLKKFLNGNSDDDIAAILARDLSPIVALDNALKDDIAVANKRKLSRRTARPLFSRQLTNGNAVKNHENDSNPENVSIPHEYDAIAVLVLACDRVTISKCLNGLINYRPSEKRFPIIVSQDCVHDKTTEVIRSYGDKIYRIRQPDQRDIAVPPREKKFKGYFKISRHYAWALNQTFVRYNFSSAIVVEDDLEVAPDFYEYFRATLPILQRDSTLWCVSAWNDNGIASLVDRTANTLLYRTDFFPGLGWMLLKSLWLELMNIWPKSYWDDWIRRPEQRRGRSCIRPELSRTKTFGKIGVSNGLFYEKYLKYIHLNEHFAPFDKINLTYLMKDSYDSLYEKIVYDSPLVRWQDLKLPGNPPLPSPSSSSSAASIASGAGAGFTTTGTVRIAYQSKESYKQICKQLGLMDDLRSGVPRTAYRGIVSFVYRNRRVFLAPERPFLGYDIFERV